MPEKTAWKWLRDDGCTNVNVAAWILRGHLNETGSLAKAVAHYHSRTPYLGSKYKHKVVEAMRRKGLIAPAAPESPAKKTSDSAKWVTMERKSNGEDKG